MLITLIDGSPKKTESASSVILAILKEKLINNANTIQWIKPENPEETLRFPILESNSLVFAFPLYMDSIPSGLLVFLEDLTVKADLDKSEKKSQGNKIFTYAVVNSGFYDKERANLALENLRLFCELSGFSYGQGLALEGGPLISLRPERAKKGSWPFGKHMAALSKLAQNIKTLSVAPDIEAPPDMPRFLYNFGANLYLRHEARKNGLGRKDLMV
jgi:hypothetical protein